MRDWQVRTVSSQYFASSFAAFNLADELTVQAITFGDLVEAAVEQGVGNAGLLLHAIGSLNKRARGRADVEDQVRLQLQQHFEIGGVAAPGQPAELGPSADLRIEKGKLGRAVGARPAEQRARLQRVVRDCRRGAGRKYALDPFRYRDGAAGGIDNRCCAGNVRHCEEARRCGEKATARQLHGTASSLVWPRQLKVLKPIGKRARLAKPKAGDQRRSAGTTRNGIMPNRTLTSAKTITRS